MISCYNKALKPLQTMSAVQQSWSNSRVCWTMHALHAASNSEHVHPQPMHVQSGANPVHAHSINHVAHALLSLNYFITL